MSLLVAGPAGQGAACQKTAHLHQAYVLQWQGGHGMGAFGPWLARKLLVKWHKEEWRGFPQVHGKKCIVRRHSVSEADILIQNHPSSTMFLKPQERKEALNISESS